MNLSSFIMSNMDAILTEWDAFARASEPEQGTMSADALRDHARTMLEDIAREMNAAQSEEQQQRKSEGHEPHVSGEESAATLHGRERHLSDFTLITLSAEFRALRATVLRLWQPHLEHADASALEQVIRFNEGIDKAVAESINSWANRTNHARELFLAILGHDLRSPLAAVALAGDMLAQPDVSGERAHKLALNVTRAAGTMSNMIDDLMGYTSIQLGGSMPHHPESCDLLPALQEAIEDAKATYQGAHFQLHSPASLVGCYDRTRLYQMFLNLLVNAARYSQQDCPVVVEASDASGNRVVTITNQGKPIPAASLESIFRPLVHLENAEAHYARPRSSLGLGLYIARNIAERHGGSIVVTSSKAEGTCFSVQLPGTNENEADRLQPESERK